LTKNIVQKREAMNAILAANPDRYFSGLDDLEIKRLMSPACLLETQIAHVSNLMVEPEAFNAGLDRSSIFYTCAIAFSLAHQLGRSPLEVAKTIAEPINELVSDRFLLEVEGDGWLNFTLRDWYIAESLITLSHALEIRSDRVPISGAAKSTINFAGYSYVQYAYARSCALLRLVPKVELANNLQTLNWQLLDSEGNLYLRTRLEQSLAFCLLTIADEIVRNSSSSKAIDRSITIKLSKNLATNFLDFYNSCRILSADRELAQARIGLIATTKKAIAHLVASQICLPESL
jgi:arginyl-tRNA synthetase